MSIVIIGTWKQSKDVFGSSQRSRHREIYPHAELNQSVHRFKLSVTEGRTHGIAWVRPVIAQEIDQRRLHAALTRYPTRANEH